MSEEEKTILSLLRSPELFVLKQKVKEEANPEKKVPEVAKKEKVKATPKKPIVVSEAKPKKPKSTAPSKKKTAAKTAAKTKKAS